MKDTSKANQDALKSHAECEKERAAAERGEAERAELIRRGGWHDGRLDCVAGNGVMSELGFGIEALRESDYMTASSQADDSEVATLGKTTAKPARRGEEYLDNERDFIASLPVLVLNNFTMKASRNTELWNVLAEWGAGLVESRVSIGLGFLSMTHLTVPPKRSPMSSSSAIPPVLRKRSLEVIMFCDAWFTTAH